jgi:signal recognition particle subunit SRP54
MFDSLTDRLDDVFRKIRGHARLTEENIQAALREVRLALLEADVNFKVVRISSNGYASGPRARMSSKA